MGFLLALFFLSCAMTSDPSQLTVNGTRVESPLPIRTVDGSPFVESGILEKALAISAKTYPDAGRLVLCKDDACYSLPLAECIEEEDRLWIPIRIASESLGWNVEIDGSTVAIDEKKRDAKLPTALPDLGRVGVGEKMPEFVLPDLKGKPVRLSDFRGKRLLLVNWASW